MPGRVTAVRRRGLGRGCLVLSGLAVGVAIALAGAATSGSAASAATSPAAPSVLVGCLGVDPGTNASQIRVGLVVSGPDGLYRAVLAGPAGLVQGEGRIVGGRGLIIVPASGTGAYDNLVVTDVDTGTAIDHSRLDGALPLMVSNTAIGCDPAALVVPADATSTTLPSSSTSVASSGTSASTTASTVAPTPDISALGSKSSAASASAEGVSTTEDVPPWLLLTIPGLLLMVGGIVLLVRARSRSRSRPAT